MPKLNPHINFNGNAEEAFLFYQSVFGGEFTNILRFKDISSEEYPIPEHEAQKIMFIGLHIGNDILMANDVPESMGRTNENENRSKISISTDSLDETNRIYNGLTNGGQIEVPLNQSSPNSYFAMFRDKYGIEWMLNYMEN